VNQTPLQDSAALLRLLTDNARDVLFRIRIGPPPTFDYVSPAVEAVSGYPPEEFYRDPGLGQRVVHPDDRAGLDLLDSLRGRVVRWIHRDGHVVHIEPRANMVRDEAGAPVAVEGILRDVSVRVQAEEALRESEARLRSVFAAMAEGVLVFDDQGRLVDCNASAERVLGWPREALLGLTSTEGWPALRDDGTRYSADELPVNRTLRTGQPVRDVLTGILRADGSISWVSISSEPLFRAGENRLRGAMVSCADVNAERRAWIEVRRREAQFQLAMECGGWDYFEFDLASSRIITRQARMDLIEPSSPDDLKAWFALIHPDDRNRVEATLTDHVVGRTPTFVSEVRWQRRDGSWRWILHSGRAIVRDAHGRATRIAGTSMDITEIRELRGRLRDAERLAAVGTLAAGVAHEINNPLAYVMANLTLATEALAGPAASPGSDGAPTAPVADVRQALRDAMNGAERVRGIVRGLQVFARPPRGEESGPVDLKTEIDAAVGIARNEIAHRARLDIALPDGLPPVRGAPRELSHVFTNLLVNAAHAIPEGHAPENVIRIAARLEGEQVLVEVSDTGTGVAAADLPRLFDPFFTTNPGGVGRGLGLSVCHGIVTSLGGTIQVESAPGRGSTFRVALLVEHGKPAPAPAPVAAPQAARRGRVLVIDDEPLVARSLARLLAAHDVTVLTSAVEVLTRASAGERWDVVLCDLMMPEMDGMELEQRLSVEAPDLVPRIVYLTGGAFTDRARQFLGAGRPHLEKPISPTVLRAKVAERIAAVLGK
jgi:PAS domain S-box-containing protein